MPATIKEAVEELIMVVDTGKLSAKDHDFGISLCEYYRKHGKLSDKQLYWVMKFIAEASGAKVSLPAVAANKPQATVDTMAFDAEPLRAIFDKARSFLKYPSITLSGAPITSGKLRIYLSTHSTNYANHLMFKSATSDLDKLLYASVDPMGKGTLYFYPLRQRLALGSYKKEDNTELVNLIIGISLDPTRVTKMNGIKFSHCCFCNNELTNASSLYHGYGPVCAEHYGLPWGEVPAKLEDISAPEAPTTTTKAKDTKYAGPF